MHTALGVDAFRDDFVQISLTHILQDYFTYEEAYLKNRDHLNQY